MKSASEQLAHLRRDGVLATGPVALVIAEDDVALDATLLHLLDRGFRTVLVALPEGMALTTDRPEVCPITAITAGPGRTEALVNAVIGALPSGTWLHYCYNGEFLIHPFAETRSVSEMLDFHTSERRAAMATMVIDLYARDLTVHPDGVDLDTPAFDRTGYFGEVAPDRPEEVALQGGLRWRYGDEIAPGQHRLDRYALVRARPGLRLLAGHRWSDPALNTQACPWHRNLTSVIASFRAAKALRSTPGPADRIASFAWPGSADFDWSSRQMLDAGFMEVGQWF